LLPYSIQGLRNSYGSCCGGGLYTLNPYLPELFRELVIGSGKLIQEPYQQKDDEHSDKVHEGTIYIRARRFDTCGRINNFLAPLWESWMAP
jgi:hypothetical protein